MSGVEWERMSGVDQLDRLLQSYHPAIHMRKRWWALFVNILNASVASSWRFYQKEIPDENITHNDFQRYITGVKIKSTDESIRQNDRGSSKLLSEVRLDNVGNLVPNATQGGCPMCQTKLRKK